jgi:SNF2 family DNA or RNA helicase
VLLFSRSTRMLDILERFLKQETYTPARLDGHTPVRERHGIVQRFKNNPYSFVFLISTKAGVRYYLKHNFK